jgi:Cof subfamily protein (haloacid dehalogenase superfamily)
MNIQLIVIDVDGTLENSQHQISERTEKTLKAALDRGCKIVLATGKTPIATAYIVQKFNLTTPGIYSQGSMIYNADRTPRHQHTLKPDIARQVITFAEDRGFVAVAYSGLRILMRTLKGVVPSQISQSLQAHHEPALEAVGALQNVLDDLPINKLILYNAAGTQTIASLRWQLNAQINGAISQVVVNDALEILPPGQNKGGALKQLLKDLKIAPEQVMAIGDGENDIEMLQQVGMGIAVGNAKEKLKAVAKHVVASNDEDGVAEAIERYVLETPVQQPLETAKTVDAAPTVAVADKPEEGSKP